MRRFRPSIAHLLLLVVFSGVALAALRSTSGWWASGLFSLAAGSLLLAPLVASYGRDGRRAFWVGFSVVGWGYLLLSLIPEARSHLATTSVLGYVHAHRLGSGDESVLISTASGGVTILSGSSIQFRNSSGKPLSVLPTGPEPFLRTGHSLFTLLFAVLGGIVAGHLHATHDGPSPSPRSPRHPADPDPPSE